MLKQINYQRLNHLIWIEVRKLKTHPALLVPGWTGFQITIRKDMVILESIISYLDTLDSPATDQKTAFEVLCRGCEIRDRLKLKAVVCVFDQAFYAKAIEIFWKNKNVFENLVLMLGGFHLLMMLLGIMGTRYGDAGLRELAVQSEVVAEGSIERVFEGKNYNRAVRLHKVVYEALFRMLLNKFEASLPAHAIDIFQQKEILIESFKLDLCKDGFERIFMSKEFREWNDLLVTHMNETKSKGSDLEKFWLTYLDLCELLLNLIFATRSGNWELYLACTEEVIPWAFAHDRHKYARSLLPFLNDMRDLPATFPEVYAAFCNGEFSVQMSPSNPFGGNEADKTIENTINRDCKTGGGYIGFSASFPATQRWVLNASRRAKYRKLIREHLSLKPEGYIHKELAAARIKIDSEAVEKVQDVLENVLANPWNGGELASLSTGVLASDTIKDNLLNARKYGATNCKEFVESRCSSLQTIDFFDPLKQVNLQTFKHLKKVVKVSAKN